MKNLMAVLGLCFTLGCATATVRPYIGDQQAWPTGSGSIVNTRYDLPVFTSLPPAQYEVMGEIRIASAFYAQPEEQHLPLLVKKGVELGADALVLVDGAIYFSTSYGAATGDGAATGGGTSLSQVNKFNPESFEKNVNVIAIRWRNGPPQGMPARYAKYTQKTMMPAEPAATPPTPAAPEPAVQAQPAPAAVPPPAAPDQPAPAAPATPEAPAAAPANP